MFAVRSALFFVFAYSLTMLPTHSFATTISFDDMGDASAYIFSDFNGNQNDSQNTLLIGGNATLNAYTVGTLNPENSLALLVNGNLDMTGGDVNGLASIAGSTTISNASALNTTDAQRNFNQLHFQTLSASIADENQNTAFIDGGKLVLSGDISNNTLFVNTTSEDLQSVWGLFTQHIDFGTRLVINVSGNDIDINSKDWLIKNESYLSHQSENVLYNFFEANTINIAGGFYGSILAPDADVIGQSGMVYGQLIANSFDGGSQLNQAVFNVDPELGSVSVDAPTTALLLPLGVFLMSLIRRKKRTV